MLWASTRYTSVSTNPLSTATREEYRQIINAVRQGRKLLLAVWFFMFISIITLLYVGHEPSFSRTSLSVIAITENKININSTELSEQFAYHINNDQSVLYCTNIHKITVSTSLVNETKRRIVLKHPMGSIIDGYYNNNDHSQCSIHYPTVLILNYILLIAEFIIMIIFFIALLRYEYKLELLINHDEESTRLLQV